MEKKVYKIPVKWSVSGTMYIRASSLKVAKEAAYDTDFPKHTEYVEDTFEIIKDKELGEVQYYPEGAVIDVDESDDDEVTVTEE